MRKIIMAGIALLAGLGITWAAEPSTSPASQPQAANLAGPVDGQLPGATQDLADAMKGQVTLVAACQATSAPHLELGFSGVVHATQTFRLLERYYEHEKNAETVRIRYSYLDPGMVWARTDRAIRQDEKVIWILHNDLFGKDRAFKALPDTPENRLAIKEHVAKLPADLRATVEHAKAESQLTERLFAIKPEDWWGGSMSSKRVEPTGWAAGSGREYRWHKTDAQSGKPTDIVTVWIMEEAYSGKRDTAVADGAKELTPWRGRKVLLGIVGKSWPTAEADITQALTPKPATAPTTTNK